MKRSFTIITLVACFFFLCINSGCENNLPQKQSSSGASEIQLGSMYKIPKNGQGNTVEQQNIIDRIAVTNDPTKILWIHIIAPMTGKLILRTPVRNKMTSSGKRLEPTHADGGSGTYRLPDAPGGYHTDELLQPDGTYGQSDAYQFWFDVYRRYHQLGTAGGLGYLLTDYPIDLNNPQDEITGLYNASKAASDWQKLEEENLKKSH